jgi:hypothetical protein
MPQKSERHLHPSQPLKTALSPSLPPHSKYVMPAERRNFIRANDASCFDGVRQQGSLEQRL